MTGAANGVVRAWPLTVDERTSVPADPEGTTDSVNSLEFNPSGERLLISAGDGVESRARVISAGDGGSVAANGIVRNRRRVQRRRAARRRRERQHGQGQALRQRARHQDRGHRSQAGAESGDCGPLRPGVEPRRNPRRDRLPRRRDPGSTRKPTKSSGLSKSRYRLRPDRAPSHVQSWRPRSLPTAPGS